jgi:succinate dehydrogenase flavin-adding protein (antitoxin of CptAB toxin-antitoxin module)
VIPEIPKVKWICRRGEVCADLILSSRNFREEEVSSCSKRSSGALAE